MDDIRPWRLENLEGETSYFPTHADATGVALRTPWTLQLPSCSATSASLDWHTLLRKRLTSSASRPAGQRASRATSSPRNVLSMLHVVKASMILPMLQRSSFEAPLYLPYQ